MYGSRLFSDRSNAVTAALRGLILTIPLLAPHALAALSGGSEQLIEAVRQDDSPAVIALLNGHVNVNAKAQDGATPLSWAVMHCNTDIAARLLAAGAKPDLANVYGVSPLSLAVSNGSVSLVRILLQNGADPNLARENGETPLMTASRMGQVDSMQLLIDHGADVNRREKKFGQTALMWAAGHPDAVRLLVKSKADLKLATNSWDVKSTIYTPGFRTVGVTGIPWNFEGDYTSRKGGQSALFFAIQKRDLESARILVDAGADVNLPSADGTTPLLLALYKWETDEGRANPERSGIMAERSGAMIFVPDLPTANFLLDRGARVSVADSAGYTPLHGAVLAAVAAIRTGRGRSARAGRGSRGANGLVGGMSAAASLDSAAALKMVQRLLEAGADPNRPTLYPTPGPLGSIRINPASPGSSPLHIAATSPDVVLTGLLGEHGANPNLLRKDGLTPFAVAVQANNTDVVKEMVARGADWKMRYNPTAVVSDPAKPIALRRHEETIMHLAALTHATSVIEYLFSLGVPLDLKNAEGETPLVMADNQEVFEYVLAYEGTGDGGGKWVPRVSTTSDLIKKLLATRGGTEQSFPPSTARNAR